MEEKFFDLNIEKVLENWGIEHALREIIANALDEKILTNTREIDIFYSDGICHIRDYGRGLQYMHFTQNENSEKLESPGLIGKFGVGLKDALGVFYRNNIDVTIHSKYSTVTLAMSSKPGFNVQTLHAVFSEPEHPNMEGTDVILTGITKDALQKAKSMFLVFDENLELLEATNYGEVYSRKDDERSFIYANGVRIAEEDNFMFSYNITNINAQMKKALNRERSNVGRMAYSDTVKNILKNCSSKKVLLSLVYDIGNVMKGENKDETGWVDIASYAAKTLNKSGNVVFMTPAERAMLTNRQVEILEQSGRRLVMVTDAVFRKIEGSVGTFRTIWEEYENGFKYDFVEYSSLSKPEREVLNVSVPIFALMEKKLKTPKPNLRISESLRTDAQGQDTFGLWDLQEDAIIIKRSVLESKEAFAGLLMHEYAHYATGCDDNSREFENVLTDMLGFIYCELDGDHKNFKSGFRLFKNIKI